MSIYRRAAKRDASEAPIVEYLRAVGASVEFLSLKDGPDLLIGWMGRHNVLAEVKTGKAKLREGQQQWHRTWKGRPVVTLRTVDDAAKLIGHLRVTS